MADDIRECLDIHVWSEKAREEKKKCDRGMISLEEFKQWLSESKT